MKRNLNLLKKIGILSVLCLCLGFALVSSNTQLVAAAPCCSDCPIPPGEVEPTPQEYCTAQCGASSGSCYNLCINRVYSCWQWCNFSC